jgi:cell division GTPase FtsZ
MQTIAGWTVIGYGKSQLPLFKLPFRGHNFRGKSTETHKGMQAMDEALSELSLKCNPADAGRALYLLSAPAKEMSMDVVKDLGSYLKDIASNAIIRNGDYPRERGMLDVTVILSELSDVEKVRQYYNESASFVQVVEKRQKEAEDKLQGVKEASKDIPSLL